MKLSILHMSLLLFLCSDDLLAQDFVTKWSFSSARSSLVFSALTAGGAVNYAWSASPSGNSGSGSFSSAAGGVVFINISALAGDELILSMSPGNLRRFYFRFDQPDKDRLVDVQQWGGATWSSMESMFDQCSKLNISATDVPNLTAVHSMSRAFLGCRSLTGPANINTWNTSAVNDLSGTFASADLFNQPLGNWNTSAVTNMNQTFAAASSFNQDIGGWNTSAVTGMHGTFSNASKFNRPIGSWNTGNVNNMAFMFAGASEFNMDISGWNTGLVTNMEHMFENAKAFNQPIGNWNTSNVTSMSGMFTVAKVFNQPLGNWNTGKVTDMGAMFGSASTFNQDISLWDTGKVTNMTMMFSDAISFNRPVKTWNTASVTSMNNMFSRATSFNQEIGGWDTHNVTDMTAMFYGATVFNQDVGSLIQNSGVIVWRMLFESGLDYCNYSFSLKGWAANAGLLNLNLDAVGPSRKYCVSLANVAHDTLMARGWQISGDQPVDFLPYLVPAGTTIMATPTCEEGVFLTLPNSTEKLLHINLNGNTGFVSATAAVTVTNKEVTASAVISGAVAVPSGYYQLSDGTSTIRITRRLHTIQQAGTYSGNGGLKVRVYYDPLETVLLNNDPVPVGGKPLVIKGWFKSKKHSALELVNDLVGDELLNAVAITPLDTGKENGVSYAEFLLKDFSTIGYYASSRTQPLPVNLVSFSGRSEESRIKLSWTTSSEANSSHFEVSRSSDSRDWHRIGTQVAAGFNSGEKVYTFYDEKPLAHAYYRLKMVDADDSFTYSKIIALNASKPVNATIFPNPAASSVTISDLSKGTYIKVIDPTGTILEQHIVQSDGAYKLNVEHFPPATYLLNITSPNGMLFRTRLLKIR